ncbi:MAG TPA: hypothetical protein VGJ18_22820 [Gemmatimonadaceae bacterium]|jgi:hypothetical protein
MAQSAMPVGVHRAIVPGIPQVARSGNAPTSQLRIDGLVLGGLIGAGVGMVIESKSCDAPSCGPSRPRNALVFGAAIGVVVAFGIEELIAVMRHDD